MREGGSEVEEGWDGSLGVLWTYLCVIYYSGMSSTT